MGCWGMGMAQSDEFCEVYDSFMEAYDAGQPVSEITKNILSEYRKEFSDDDGILHDVYFALAKAEWMCCEQSSAVWDKVKHIIESGANLDFYHELGASESDLKIRKKNLDKFWTMLQTPRATPRRRKSKSGSVAEARAGMVFWYRSNGILYGALVLDVLSNGRMLVALSDKLPSVPKTVNEVLDADVYTAAWFDELLPSKRVHDIGTVEVPESYNGRAGMYHSEMVHFCENYGSPSHWAHEKRSFTLDNMKMRDLLNCENVFASFKNYERLQTLLKNDRSVIWISL